MTKKKTKEEKELKEFNDKIKKMFDKAEEDSESDKEIECLSDVVSKSFEEDGYKQNGYWEDEFFDKEYQFEYEVMVGSFIDKDLNVVSVFFDADLEFTEEEEEEDGRDE